MTTDAERRSATHHASPEQLASLLGYLDACWTAEKSCAAELQGMAAAVNEPQLKSLFEKQRLATLAQQAQLAKRLGDLGCEPGSHSGPLGAAAIRLNALLKSPDDDSHLPTQFLIKAFTTESFGMALCETLATYARAAGDHETAALARQHLRDKREATRVMWSYIAIEARRAAELIATPN